MNDLIIYVYKVLLADGTSWFRYSLGNMEDKVSVKLIQSAAEYVKIEKDGFLGEEDDPLNVTGVDPHARVFIEFHPQHDIECPQHLAPRRCFPLTEKERETFWSTFNKM